MGVAILENGQVVFMDAHKRKIVDVSGAGDSVISVAALAVGSKMPWTSVAELSNLAGGLVCEKNWCCRYRQNQIIGRSRSYRLIVVCIRSFE